MSQSFPDDAALPRRQRKLRREIGIALAIKVVLLAGLWALFFRGPVDKSAAESTIKSWFGPVSESGVSLSRKP